MCLVGFIFLQVHRITAVSGESVENLETVQAEVVISQDNYNSEDKQQILEVETEASLELASLVKTNIVKRPVVIQKEVVKKVIDSPIKTESIGTYKVTGFCNCDLCSENKVSKDIMANYKGINVASNPQEIAYGTKVWIDGVGIRQTQPSGQKLTQNEIKVFFPTHEEVVAFGEKEIEIYKIME